MIPTGCFTTLDPIHSTYSTMHDFEYDAPSDLTSALQTFAEHNGRVRALAGGTDLIDQIRIGKFSPELLIDVKQLTELNVLEPHQDYFRLGAAVPCCDIYNNPVIASSYAALADSCRIIGGVQIQNRASVGGNLCNSGPAADSIPSLIALEATCVLGSSSGTREIPVEQFCTGPGQNVLENGEILIELRLPTPPSNSGSHYRRFIPRYEMDIAVVGVGAAVTLDESGQNFISAKIALGAVAPTPLYAKEASMSLVGQPVHADSIARAAELSQNIVRPIDDMRGTKAFRVHITGVLTRRVIEAAVQRARGEQLSTKIGH